MINRTRRSFTAFMLILSILLTTIPVSSTGTAVMDAEALSRESQIFNYVHREVFEENAHVQRLAAEESLDSYVFLNADGSRTAYFLDEQVKFVDANGTVQEKDITLTYAANTFSTTQNNVGLQIPTNLSAGVRLSYGGYDVSIVPQGSSLTLPRRMDNSVVYDNYFGTGTKLIYTPTLVGVKEDIVLTAYRGISSFTFLLNTDGLRVFHTAEDRWYLAEYEEAEMRFWLGNVEVYDANLKPSLGIMTVAPIIEGQRYRLTISADPSFLTDPATAYPVTIDPTITVSDTANGAGAIEDAPIYEGYPNRNFGSYIYDRAGYGGATYKRGRTLFRLTGLTSNSTYSSLAASKLISVYFYVTEATGTTNARVNLHPLTSNTSWTEAGVTWNTVGAYSTSVSSTNLGGGNCSYFDITSLAKAWKTGSLSASAGFILIGANESSVDKSLCSSEYTTASKQPYVVATYYVCGIRLGDVPTNLRSNAIHACIPCAITNVAAYWSISEYPQFNCSTATQQETAAINVQSAMSAAGSYTANANISAGFSIFSHTSGSVTYRLQATNCWRHDNAFTFTDIVQEIDNGRPLLVGFAGTADSPFAEPHMTACAGYNISGANYYLYISDAHNATIQLYPFNISTYNDFISKVTVVQSQ